MRDALGDARCATYPWAVVHGSAAGPRCKDRRRACRLRFDGSAWRNDPRVWLPLSRTSGGDPVLVWDADNNLVITETTP